jgi:hypothetical protein
VESLLPIAPSCAPGNVDNSPAAPAAASPGEFSIPETPRGPGSVADSGRALWTVEDLARVLGCTPRAARRLCQRRQVPGARRIGARWFVHPAAFEEGFPAAAPNQARLLRLRRPAHGRDALDRAFRSA